MGGSVIIQAIAWCLFRLFRFFYTSTPHFSLHLSPPG